MKSHVPSCEADLASSIHCHLMVYADAGGVTGFDRRDQALELAKCLIADTWLVEHQEGVLRRIDQDDRWVVVLRRAVDPVATMIRRPDSTLIADADNHVEYCKAIRRSLMLQRHGKASESPKPPTITKLFEGLSRWGTDTIRYALEHSQGLLVWEFRGGEFGLHCRGLSLDPIAWTTRVKHCAQTAKVDTVLVDTLEKMPAW